MLGPDLALFAKRDRDTALGEFKGRARADDTAADNHHVDPLRQAAIAVDVGDRRHHHGYAPMISEIAEIAINLDLGHLVGDEIKLPSCLLQQDGKAVGAHDLGQEG